MIRLRTIVIVLLSACFCFVQGGVVAVYSAGVTIFYTDVTIFSTTTPTQTGGNQTPAPIPGNTGTPTATTVPASTGTQNINQNSSNSITSTSTNSSTSNQQLQQLPNTTDNLFQILEQTQTSELIRMPNFNSLSEDEPLLPLAESYAVKVCLSYNDIAVLDCHDKKTPSEASEKLAAMILNKYLKGIEVRPFRVIIPSSMPLVEQTQLLRKIETEAIAIIKAKMLEDLKNSKIFLSESEEGKHQRLNIIIDDAKRAMQEADSGNNWSHNSKYDRTSHDFQTAKAFRQFNNDISVAQWRSH